MAFNEIERTTSGKEAPPGFRWCQERADDASQRRSFQAVRCPRRRARESMGTVTVFTTVDSPSPPPSSQRRHPPTIAAVAHASASIACRRRRCPPRRRRHPPLPPPPLRHHRRCTVPAPAATASRPAIAPPYLPPTVIAATPRRRRHHHAATTAMPPPPPPSPPVAEAVAPARPPPSAAVTLPAGITAIRPAACLSPALALASSATIPIVVEVVTAACQPIARSYLPGQVAKRAPYSFEERKVSGRRRGFVYRVR